MKAFEEKFGEQPEYDEEYTDWALRKQGWKAALEWTKNKCCCIEHLIRDIQKELEEE